MRNDREEIQMHAEFGLNLEKAASPQRRRERQGTQRKNSIVPAHPLGEYVLHHNALFLCDSLRLRAFAVRFLD